MHPIQFSCILITPSSPFLFLFHIAPYKYRSMELLRSPQKLNFPPAQTSSHTASVISSACTLGVCLWIIHYDGSFSRLKKQLTLSRADIWRVCVHRVGGARQVGSPTSTSRRPFPQGLTLFWPFWRNSVWTKAQPKSQPIILRSFSTI